jgi:DNA-binding GntR family transcriptional regulator
VTQTVESARGHVSLGEQAYQRLRSDIISTRLAPGQKLTEKVLAAETGWSGSPLREALTRLDHEGLIRTLPRKGYQVTPLTPKLVDDLFDVWTIIGPEIVRRGIRNASALQIEELRQRFHEVDDVAHELTADEVQRERALDQADLAFELLARATDNEYLMTIFTRVSGDMHRIWAMVLAAYPEALDEVAQREFSDQVLADRDAEGAAENTRRHIVAMHDRVLQIFARWPSVMSSEVVPV